MLSKENVNEDLRKAKQKDLKSFKKIERDRGEAEKFELKYKKIKFFGKSETTHTLSLYINSSLFTSYLYRKEEGN